MWELDFIFFKPIYETKSLFKVTTEPPQKVVVDGEIFGATPIEVECISGGLNMLTPMVEEVIPTEKLDGLPNLVLEMKEDERV